MSTTTGWRETQIITRLKELWAELDYAQRRLLEVRTGVPMLPPERPRSAASIEDLEALYARSPSL